MIKQVITAPYTWSVWVDLHSHVGTSAYTVSYDSVSDTPLTFQVEIEYATNRGPKRQGMIGPGSYTIRDNDGAGTDRIRFKSNGPFGQTIHVTY